MATKIAWAAGRAAAMPVVTGTLRVRKSKASGLTPGGLFKLTFSQNGIADLVARVESIKVVGQVQGNSRLIREFPYNDTFKAHWQVLSAGSFVDVPADQAERYTAKRVPRDN